MQGVHTVNQRTKLLLLPANVIILVLGWIVTLSTAGERLLSEYTVIGLYTGWAKNRTIFKSGEILPRRCRNILIVRCSHCKT